MSRETEVTEVKRAKAKVGNFSHLGPGSPSCRRRRCPVIHGQVSPTHVEQIPGIAYIYASQGKKGGRENDRHLRRNVGDGESSRDKQMQNRTRSCRAAYFVVEARKLFTVASLVVAVTTILNGSA